MVAPTAGLKIAHTPLFWACGGSVCLPVEERQMHGKAAAEEEESANAALATKAKASVKLTHLQLLHQQLSSDQFFHLSAALHRRR